MEPSLAVALGALGVALIALVFLLARSAGLSAAVSKIADGQQELAGRVSELGQGIQSATRQLSDGVSGRAQHTDQTLARLGERLAVIDAAQKKITDLSEQVVGLQDILSNKQARGAFGEVQLENLVQSSLPPSAYEFQATLGNGRRADCLLKLPEPPGSIAIDAKFPLESYRALRAARDAASLKQAGREFADSVRRHLADIADRYIVPGETAESALMFLPSEAVYAELHASFGAVVEESYRLRVWIVSPTTLMATLNTIRAVLKDARMREQASLIQTEVGALLEDVRRLDQRVADLDNHFDKAQEDVRLIRISADKVVRRGNRIEGVDFDDEDEALLSR